MAAETWVNDSGVQRRLKEVWVNDNGVQRRLKECWVNDNGVQRCFFRSDVISIGISALLGSSVSPANPSVFYSLLSSGVKQTSESRDGTSPAVNNSDWVTPTSSASNFECFATVLTGSFSSGSFGSWLALTSSRTWSLTRSTTGSSVARMNLQIRRVGDSAISASADIQMTANKN